MLPLRAVLFRLHGRVDSRARPRRRHLARREATFALPPFWWTRVRPGAPFITTGLDGTQGSTRYRYLLTDPLSLSGLCPWSEDACTAGTDTANHFFRPLPVDDDEHGAAGAQPAAASVETARPAAVVSRRRRTPDRRRYRQSRGGLQQSRRPAAQLAIEEPSGRTPGAGRSGAGRRARRSAAPAVAVAWRRATLEPRQRRSLPRHWRWQRSSGCQRQGRHAALRVRGRRWTEGSKRARLPPTELSVHADDQCRPMAAAP